MRTLAYVREECRSAHVSTDEKYALHESPCSEVRLRLVEGHLAISPTQKLAMLYSEQRFPYTSSYSCP